MQRVVRGIICAVLCLTSLFQVGSAAASHTFLIVYADYPPYSFLDKNQPVGIEIDVLNEALGKQLGLKIEHQILPWSRAQMLVSNGDADAFVAVRTEARDRYAVPSEESVAFWQMSFFAKQGNPKVNEDLTPLLWSLDELKVGSLKGNGWVKQNFADERIYYAATMDSLVRMLRRGRIDLVPENEYVMDYFLQPYGGRGELVAHPYINEVGMHLYISKHSALLKHLKQIDEQLRQLHLNGQIKSIVSAYR